MTVKKIAKDIMELLGIKNCNLIAEAYIDLIIGIA